MKKIINQCNQMKVDYMKKTTGGNDPSITKPQRYSQYIENVRKRPYYADPYAYLDNRGLVYKPYVKIFTVPTTIDIINDPPIEFPREHIFIKSIQY